jgi:AAA domain
MAFSLASISRNSPKPPRIIIHGDPGVGKTTFGACAPSPIFLQTEDGLGNLDCPAFPLAKSFDDVMSALQCLYTDEHDFKTLVIDSLDWLEAIVWAQVCKTHNVATIEALNYGKGYVEALVVWRQFFEGVTALRDARSMSIVMIAHSQNVRIEDPTLPAYDSKGLKLHKRAAALAEEFADIVVYATVQTNTVTEDKGFNNKRVRATSTGERVMHTVGQPAFLAKSRFPMPSPLPLAWESLAAHINTTANQE